MGRPEFVKNASEEAAELFQEYGKARPSRDDAYAAALAFMRRQELDEDARHLLAGALNLRVKEQGGQRPIGNDRLPRLLDAYARDAADGSLWLLTWFGLLCSYFEFDPQAARAEEVKGWEALRTLLGRTWPSMSQEAGEDVVPDWVKVLRNEPELLTASAADKYGLDYMRGDESFVKRLSVDLGIPESSWFWHALVLGAVRRSAQQPDQRFKESIPRLLALIQARPVYRDDALAALLTRYQRCSQPVLHVELRDYAVRKDVWRNPKLRAAGLATAWNRVEDPVWRMVLQWINEANLRDFFEVLAARRNSDEGRLEFWSQYLDQITWTRLIFSAQTRMLAASNEGIRNLIAREEGAYATLSSNADVDAFMMQISDYVIVEFSRVPNAAYVYEADQLPFDPYGGQYSGTSADLKGGYRGEHAARITHPPGWQRDAEAELRRLGIFPDEKARAAPRGVRSPAPPPLNTKPATAPAETAPVAPISTTNAAQAALLRSGTVVDTAPVGAAFTMAGLRGVLSDYPGASIDDRRTSLGGRLWVEDPRQRVALSVHMKRLGFKWAAAREAWYYPES